MHYSTEINEICCSDYFYTCRGLLHMGGTKVAEARRQARLAVGVFPAGLRAQIADAVEENIENRKANDFESLCRRYGLPLSHYSFRQCKMRYCRMFLACILEEQQSL